MVRVAGLVVVVGGCLMVASAALVSGVAGGLFVAGVLLIAGAYPTVQRAARGGG